MGPKRAASVARSSACGADCSSGAGTLAHLTYEHGLVRRNWIVFWAIAFGLWWSWGWIGLTAIVAEHLGCPHRWGGELARHLKVSARVERRWKAEAKHGSGYLFNLAPRIGLLHILLPSACEPGFVETTEADPSQDWRQTPGTGQTAQPSCRLGFTNRRAWPGFPWSRKGCRETGWRSGNLGATACTRRPRREGRVRHTLEKYYDGLPRDTIHEKVYAKGFREGRDYVNDTLDQEQLTLWDIAMVCQ